MSDPIQLLSTTVEISNTLAPAKVITGITKATEAVLTSTAHGFLAGDIILIDAVVGMNQINKVPIIVKTAPTANDFTAEGLDSTGFTTYVSGGTAQKVTSFLSFDVMTTFNFPEPQPNKQSVTTIHASSEKEVFGLDSAPTCTMDCNAQPLDATIKYVRKVSLAKSDAILRAKFQNGNVMLVNAKWAGGRGIDGSAGEVAKAQISLSFVCDEQWFVS